jgi:hypothetical protein
MYALLFNLLSSDVAFLIWEHSLHLCVLLDILLYGLAGEFICYS